MTLLTWQRSNILGALNYLKDLARTSKDSRAEMLAQGLMEVLEPSRRTIRLQREAAQSGRERRTGRERRMTSDRRKKLEPHNGPERRAGRDRRSTDRRGSSY